MKQAAQLGTVPLILQAETYEKPSERAIASAREHASAWEPENGTERMAYTLLADILTGVGFALLLGAGLTLREKPRTLAAVCGWLGKPHHVNRQREYLGRNLLGGETVPRLVDDGLNRHTRSPDTSIARGRRADRRDR